MTALHRASEPEEETGSAPARGGSAASHRHDAADLEALLLCAAAGDPGCFEGVYDAVAPLVLGLVLRIVRDRAQAEEVVQDVFLEIWQKAPSFRPDRGGARSWITVIAHRRAVDRVRAARAAAERDLEQGIKEFSESYEHVHETVARRMDSEEVARALGALPAPQTEALALAYFGGYSQSQIAERLGVPLGTVKTRTRQGLKQLRLILGGTDARIAHA